MTQKAVYKSKVFWASIVTLILGLIGIFTQLIPPEYMAYIVVIVAVLNLVLRYLTDQPIGLRDIKAVTDTLKNLKTEPINK